MAAHDTDMEGGALPPPPVAASKPFLPPAVMWERFSRALPDALRGASEDEQIAYFRRLYASYQQQFSRERAKRDRAVFECIDQYRSYILAHYVPKYPYLRELREEFLHPDFLAVLRAPSPAAWKDFATEVHPGVFRFNILTADWCSKLLEEVDAFEAWSKAANLHVNRPNSMNNYGCVLDDMGFNDALQRLTVGPIRQLASALFGPASGGATLDSHHGFIVEYAPRKDRALGFHVDDSEITLNLCLGTAFEGGDLFFRGPRCPSHQQDPCAPEEFFQYKHEAGVAVMHIGRHRHGALPLTAGRRANLILWCRSSAFREGTDLGTCQPFCARHASHRLSGAANAAAAAEVAAASSRARGFTPGGASSASSSAAAAEEAGVEHSSASPVCAAHAPAPGAGSEAPPDADAGSIGHASSSRASSASFASSSSVASTAPAAPTTIAPATWTNAPMPAASEAPPGHPESSSFSSPP